VAGAINLLHEVFFLYCKKQKGPHKHFQSATYPLWEGIIFSCFQPSNNYSYHLLNCFTAAFVSVIYGGYKICLPRCLKLLYVAVKTL